MRHPFACRACVVPVAVVASLILAACPLDKPEDHLARGKQLAAKQDHGAAAIEFKNYLQSVPRSAEGRFLLGRELFAQGDARAAEIELQKAYDGRYDRDTVAPLLVESQLSQGQPDKISEQLAKTELKTPEANAKLNGLLGDAALLQGKLDDALRLYRMAQQWQPGFIPARLGEARINVSRGDLDRANALLLPILANDPKNVRGLAVKGDIARLKGDTPEAIKTFAMIVQQTPWNVNARLNLADLYLGSSQDANARALAQDQVTELRKLAPRNPAVNYFDALLAFGKGDYLHANDAITLSLAENPNNGVAQTLSGAVSLAMNQPGLAEVHLIEGIRLTRNSLYARRLLANLYLHQNQPQKATEVLGPALQAAPSDPALIGLAGQVALQQGDYANASKLFNRAGQLDPKNIALKVSSASADLARGDSVSGLAALEAAVKASPDDARPDIALVIARLNRREFDEALVAWQNLEKAQPKSPITYNLRSAIDLGKNDRVGARKALQHALELQPNFFPAVRNLAALDELEGHPDAARQTYRTLLEKDKGNTAGLISLAEFEAQHAAKPEVVIDLLQEARRSNPNGEQPVVALVSYYVSQNNLPQALAIAQDGLARIPDNPTFLSLIGGLQLRLGGVDQAIAAYNKLVAMKPEEDEYKVRLAQAMVLVNQAERAVPIFVDVIKRKPDDYATQSTAVTALLGARKTAEANSVLATIRASSPKSPVLVELDGDVKLGARQYADAAVSYRKALDQTPASTPIFMKLYFSTQSAHKELEAATMLAGWLKAHPADVSVRILDANVALRARDYDRAAKGYRIALESKPGDVGALNNLAMVLWQQKNPDAINYAQKAYSLAPTSAAVGDTLGWILVDKGDTRSGLEVLQRAYASGPPQPPIALHLAKAQLKDGQKDAARTTMQALLRAAPGSPEAKEAREMLAKL